MKKIKKSLKYEAPYPYDIGNQEVKNICKEIERCFSYLEDIHLDFSNFNKNNTPMIYIDSCHKIKETGWFTKENGFISVGTSLLKMQKLKKLHLCLSN